MATDRPADDLHLMILLWQSPRTRDVALDLADKNREAAKASPILPDRKAA